MRFKAFPSRAGLIDRGVVAAVIFASLVAAACAPKADDGRTWSDWEENGELVLQHAPEESDNVSILLRCAEGSGLVTVEVPVPADWRAASLAVKSGSTRGVWPARFRADGEIMDGWAIARVRARDPVLTAFAQTGRLGGKDIGDLDAPLAEERRVIDRFFKICGQGDSAGKS